MSNQWYCKSCLYSKGDLVCSGCYHQSEYTPMSEEGKGMNKQPEVKGMKKKEMRKMIATGKEFKDTATSFIYKFTDNGLMIQSLKTKKWSSSSRDMIGILDNSNDFTPLPVVPKAKKFKPIIGNEYYRTNPAYTGDKVAYNMWRNDEVDNIYYSLGLIAKTEGEVKELFLIAVKAIKKATKKWRKEKANG